VSNVRLRSAVFRTGIGMQGLADVVGVDRKTVERWISGRPPYRRHMFAVAAELRLDVAYLWRLYATERGRARSCAVG